MKIQIVLKKQNQYVYGFAEDCRTVEEAITKYSGFNWADDVKFVTAREFKSGEMKPYV